MSTADSEERDPRRGSSPCTALTIDRNVTAKEYVAARREALQYLDTERRGSGHPQRSENHAVMTRLSEETPTALGGPVEQMVDERLRLPSLVM